MALLKKKSVKLTVADLLAFAGVTMTVTSVDRSGTDDGNACTLHGTADGDDVQITFSRLAYDHTEADIGGASCGLLKCDEAGKFLLAGLPVLDKADCHESGRPCDHALARIKLDRAAATDEAPVVLAWVE